MKDVTDPFEKNRSHLKAVAYRMLGSSSEADDAVQEAWLRVNRAEASEIENVRGWLTTIVARICLDMLRARKARREEPEEERTQERAQERAGDPERDRVLADSVGLALLVVLDALEPAERLAFVLHDMFDLPFEEIAPIVGRSTEAARQLASRARRRVRGAELPEAELAAKRRVVDAYVAAIRSGDMNALLEVLDPDLVVRVDVPEREIRGAREWAKGALVFGRAVQIAETALVDGEVGVIVARKGKLWRALRIGFTNGKIARIDVIASDATLAGLEIKTGA